MEQDFSPQKITLVSPAPVYRFLNEGCTGVRHSSSPESASLTVYYSTATSQSVASSRFSVQEPSRVTEHSRSDQSYNSDVTVRASHKHKQQFRPLPDDSTRLRLIAMQVKPHLHKWFHIIETLILAEGDRSAVVNPHLHFDDIPWPVKDASKVLGAFPLTRAMEAEIKQMLSMGGQRGYHSQIQFNILVWGHLDFEKRILPLVLPSDRRWVWSAKKQISRAIGFYIQEDLPGEHPFLRPRQLSDDRDPDHEFVFDF